jgi:hypothetical protein
LSIYMAGEVSAFGGAACGTQRDAHCFRQVWTQTLNDDLKDTFGCWYPAMRYTETPLRRLPCPRFGLVANEREQN